MDWPECRLWMHAGGYHSRCGAFVPPLVSMGFDIYLPELMATVDSDAIHEGTRWGNYLFGWGNDLPVFIASDVGGEWASVEPGMVILDPSFYDAINLMSIYSMLNSLCRLGSLRMPIFDEAGQQLDSVKLAAKILYDTLYKG